MIQRERAHDLWDEIDELIKDHYHEIAHYQDIPLSPDKEKYEKAEDNDRFRIYTVRLEGKLVGYAAFFLGYAIHYSTSYQAQEDVIFITPLERKGSLGMKLLLYSEKELKKDGVEVIYHHVKIGHPALQSLLERTGYKAVDTLLCKRI